MKLLEEILDVAWMGLILWGVGYAFTKLDGIAWLDRLTG